MAGVAKLSEGVLEEDQAVRGDTFNFVHVRNKWDTQEAVG